MKSRTRAWLACFALYAGGGVFVAGAVVESLAAASVGLVVMALASFVI